MRDPKVLLHLEESEQKEKIRNRKEIMYTLYGGKKIVPVKIPMEGISIRKNLVFRPSSI